MGNFKTTITFCLAFLFVGKIIFDCCYNGNNMNSVAGLTREEAKVKRARERKSAERERKKQQKCNKRKVNVIIKTRCINNTKKRKQRNKEEKQAKRAKSGTSKFLSDEEKQKSILFFEHLCKSINHNHCHVCHRVAINLEMSCETNVCKECHNSNYTKESYLKENMLPIWRDKSGNVHYEEPCIMKDLSNAEKLLIQKLSIFVPLHHIRNGTYGIKGHVCCFPQNVMSVCDVLPRLPDDVTIVKFVKMYEKDIGGNVAVKEFKVRKWKVISVLKWLKEHHSEYSDIVIQERNLDWMGDESEKQLPCTVDLNVHNIDPEVSYMLQHINDMIIDYIN